MICMHEESDKECEKMSSQVDRKNEEYENKSTVASDSKQFIVPICRDILRDTYKVGQFDTKHCSVPYSTLLS
jgi:hypothetical protein